MRIEQMIEKIEQLAEENGKLKWHEDEAALQKLLHNVRDIEILELELDEVRKRNRISLVTWT